MTLRGAVGVGSLGYFRVEGSAGQVHTWNRGSEGQRQGEAQGLGTRMASAPHCPWGPCGEGA